jgi:hypothetical protein
MTGSTDCTDRRRDWMAAFDAGETPPASLEAHLEICPGCRAFAESTHVLRRTLAGQPLPPVDTRADDLLIQALRPAAPDPARGLLRGLLRGPHFSLAAAGVASFAITLAAASLSMHLGSADPMGAAAARHPSASEQHLVIEVDRLLDEWLEQGGGRPPRPAPRPVPEVPEERGERRRVQPVPYG